MRHFFAFISWGGAFALLSFLTWEIFIHPWRAANRSLAELPHIEGQLASATIRRSTGKFSHYFLNVVLTNHAQEFSIRDDRCEQPLHALLSQLRPGQPIIVYYESSWALFGLDIQPNFNVYQLESGGRVIYGLTEVRQQYLNQGGWGLVFLCVVGLPIFGFYWRHRAES